MQSAQTKLTYETEIRYLMLFIVWVNDVIGHTWAVKYIFPLVRLQMVISSNFCFRSRNKFLEIKLLIFCLIFSSWWTTQMFFFKSTEKIKGLTIPTHLEGSVRRNILLTLCKLFKLTCFSLPLVKHGDKVLRILFHLSSLTAVMASSKGPFNKFSCEHEDIEEEEKHSWCSLLGLDMFYN